MKIRDDRGQMVQTFNWPKGVFDSRSPHHELVRLYLKKDRKNFIRFIVTESMMRILCALILLAIGLFGYIFGAQKSILILIVLGAYFLFDALIDLIKVNKNIDKSGESYRNMLGLTLAGASVVEALVPVEAVDLVAEIWNAFVADLGRSAILVGLGGL
ncbi:MAG: hypothetical protein JKY96_08485, partial [Phycisphaerales bacterium]|nr:hypothetical protein [Phycisphaerales bacterium]